MTAGCVEQDDWSCHGPRAGLCGWRSRAGEGSAVQYEIVAEAYRDLERAGGRLALIDSLTALLAATPAGLLPTVCYLCQGLIAPQFAGVDLGLAEKAHRPVIGLARHDLAGRLRSSCVTGRKGYARVNRCTGRGIQQPSLEIYVDGQMRGYHALDDDWASSFRDSGRHWLRWLHTGDGPLLWSGEEAVDVLRFALAAYESSASGGVGIDPGQVT